MCDNESLNYAASEAYEEVTGEELDYETGEFTDPAGDMWEEETIDSLFPKLAKQFSGE